jgi:hypothetical protein
VFDNQQPVMELPGTEFGELRRMQKSPINAKTTIYSRSGHWYSIIPYVQFGWCLCVVGLLCMIDCIQGVARWAPASLYIVQRTGRISSWIQLESFSSIT